MNRLATLAWVTLSVPSTPSTGASSHCSIAKVQSTCLIMSSNLRSPTKLGVGGADRLGKTRQHPRPKAEPPKGLLDRRHSETKFSLARYDPTDPDVGYFVSHYWVVAWRLTGL